MILEECFTSPSLKKLQALLKSGQDVLLEELWDVPKAIIACLALKTTNRSVLILTGGMREDKLFDNLEELAPDLTIEFPAWETLPGEEIAPSPDIIGKRMEALNTLIHSKRPRIVLCPLTSFLQKIAPKEDLSVRLETWKVKDRIAFNELSQKLTSLGYKRTAVVADKGEFAIRGGIVDLFPTGSADPFRVDFFGDEIEQIRTFDPASQKSIQKVHSFSLGPASELKLLQESKQLVSILEYLGQDPIILWDDLIAIEDTYVALKQMSGANSPYFYPLHERLDAISNRLQIYCAPQKLEQWSALENERPRGVVQFEVMAKSFQAERFFHSFRPIQDYLEPEFSFDSEFTLCFLNSNETEENEVKEKLSAIQLPPTTRFERGYLTSGFILSDLFLAVIPNPEISHRPKIRRQKWRSTYHTPAAEFHQLSPGDLVVHFHSGIGRYRGMEKQINHQGQQTEFLTIEYADQSKLFVPLSQAYLVSRYIGGGHDSMPHLSQLGSKRWQTARHHAQAQILGYASDLLQLYAARQAHGGFQYPPDSDLMRRFESDFPYHETPDQLLAIDAIKNDMTSGKAMDRLVCGDVGYGKTEVAMRAAFKAACDGNKQVAVLVPTTVLAMQHFENFTQRMGGFPVVVDVVSRFRTPKQIKETLKKVEDGKVDILIGTHRLLSQDIHFKNFGLVIIDEEQRFGVRAKEHLKKIKTGVDCITLSATPIPRTLYMSLITARDMSVINTPPQDRLPIKTIIAETDFQLISNAILRELTRGGQIYFIHNRVESIYERAHAIGQLVPQARVGVVHGQMTSEQIDPIFHAFKLGQIDLLFATTIIENGIDIPNANTILIDRADTYGLADLYQLRGRVGRWNRAAYAYFLIPKETLLPEPTRKRLNALVEAGGYGGGMKIAMRDLEIRGAGDILGVQQSGQVSTIGFHLYCKLLKKAIEAIKKQKAITFEETKIEAPYDARIPDSYIEEVSLRMEIYYRLGDATTHAELDALLEEIQDRFGEPPQPVLWLYHLAKLRTFASANHFTLLKFGNLSLLAEQQQGKTLEKKTLILPKQFQNPKDLEWFTIEQLKANFPCESIAKLI